VHAAVDDQAAAAEGDRLEIAEPARREIVIDAELVDQLLLSPMGRRDWPLRFYSAGLLSSVEARRAFVPPDVAARS
jgi:hypothetical protein